MTTATIDTANLKVQFHADAEEARAYADKHGHLFIGKPDDMAELSGPQLVALYNATCDELNASGSSLAHTKRFANKEAGVKRVIANLLELFELRRTMEKAKAAPKPVKAPAAASASKGTNLAPKSKAYPCKAGTKQARIVDLLFRPQGASFDELHQAMSQEFPHLKPWAEVTTRSALNWDINKVKGYGVRTEHVKGELRYFLVLPAGQVAPHPHTPRKG